MLSRALAGFAVVALGVVAQAPSNETQTPFALATPGQLVQCKNTTIVWQGGQSPYKVSLKPVCGSGKNASEEVHSVFGTGSTSVDMPIKFLADTPIIVSITDSNNMEATAPEIVVASGDANDSCSTQTACTDAPIQAPSAPIAAADPTATGTGAVPTDHLLTANPSSTTYPSSSMASSSVLLLYSYVTASGSSTSTPTSTPLTRTNAAVSAKAAPTVVVLGCIVLVGANLFLGLS